MEPDSAVESRSVRPGCEGTFVRADDQPLLRDHHPDVLQRLVIEWAGLHRDGLLRNWESARAGEPLEAIEPLS